MTMLKDLKFAARTLAHARGFTVTSLLILAVGIGATATMFSATNTVLLKPLPYPQSDRIVEIRETRPQAEFARTVVTAGEYVAWTRGSRVVQDAAIVDYPGLALADGRHEAVRLGALRVSAEFFPLFDIRPIAGRPFSREAEQPGNGDVVLISHRVWQERFDGAADVVGRTVRIDGRPAVILGILPAGFSFQMRVDLIVPMTLSPEVLLQNDHSYDVFARLAPGVTRQQAAAELTRAAVASQGTPVHLTGATVVPLREEVLGDAETPMLVMFGAVGFVLLIACANLANLLLARGAARQREIAIRAALGAGRGRIVRQLLSEAVLLSTVGGAFGLLLATWLAELLARNAAGSIPRADEIHVDAVTVAFATAVALVTGTLFGIVPAWHAARTDVNDTLKSEARGGSASRRRALGAFAVAELALSMILLVGAGLLLGTFGHLRRVNPGFDASRVLVVPAFLPQWKYHDDAAQRSFFDRATRALGEVPGVEAVGATNALPLSGDNTSGSLTIEGAPAPAPEERPNADRRAVTPGFHRALGIHVRDGRLFEASDDEHAALVVIVSRALAERYWPHQSPVGRRLKLGRFETEAPWRTVIGVVDDVQHRTLADRPRPVVYCPYAQGPTPAMQIVIRAAASPSAIAGAVRGVIAKIDPDLPVSELKPMTSLLSGALAETEVALSLLGAFAVIAVTLAATGIYGVMAYAVAQRRVEFGIRMALGASRSDLLKLVGLHGVRLTAIGIALGLGGAALTSSLLETMLAGVSPGDPRVFAATAAFLGAVSLLACLAPAIHATRVEPNNALRAT
jgi:predicted permease